MLWLLHEFMLIIYSYYLSRACKRTEN